MSSFGSLKEKRAQREKSGGVSGLSSLPRSSSGSTSRSDAAGKVKDSVPSAVELSGPMHSTTHVAMPAVTATQAVVTSNAMPQQSEASHADAAPEAMPSVPTSTSVQTKAGTSGRRTLPENEDLEVRSTPDKGRAIFWKGSTKCRKGSTLLRIQPHMSVISSSLIRTHCAYCMAVPSRSADSQAQKPRLRCSACHVLLYCNPTCQRADWKAHKEECKALQRFQAAARNAKKAAGRASKPEEEDPDSVDMGTLDHEPGTSVRALARIVWGRRRLGEDWWSEITSMQSHLMDLSPEQLEPMINLTRKLCFFLGISLQHGKVDASTDRDPKLEELGFSSHSELVNLVCLFSSNAFTAAASDLAPLGMCVSPVVALFNHSCAPNAVVVWPNGPGTTSPKGGKMHVVAIKNIKPGEEIVTAYVDVSDGRHVRQAALQERYYFNCTCELCSPSPEAPIDPREALWCSKHCGGWLPKPALEGIESIKMQCQSCKQTTSVYIPQLKGLLKRGTEAARMISKLLDDGEDYKVLQMVNAILPSLSAWLPPSSYPLFSILRTTQLALLSTASATAPASDLPTDISNLGALDDAARLGLLLVAATQAGARPVFPAHHPARAMAVAVASKILLSDAHAESIANATSTPNSTVSMPPSAPSMLKLHREPPLPPPGVQRLMLGHQLARTAVAELDIAFGRDEEGGQVGKSVREMLVSFEREMRLSSGAA